jgi:carboxymethylenebutenolidase
MMAVKIPTCGSMPLLRWAATAEEATQIKAPLLHYAGLDSRVNEGWPAYETILKRIKVENTAYTYPGVNHGFHNTWI